MLVLTAGTRYNSNHYGKGMPFRRVPLSAKGWLRLRAFRFAIRQIIPLIFAYLFVGIASGLLLHKAGYAPVWAFLSALLIYAGSMQIVMVTLMTSGVPLYMVALMTLFINARHVFYGISFIDDFRACGRRKGCGWKYPYMALTLTDETYSVLCALQVPPDVDKSQAQFYIQLSCHMLWVFSCTLGAVLGQMIPVDMTGIDFSATALFVAVVVNQWQGARSHLPAIIGVVSAVVFYFVLGPDKLILPALSVSVIALILLKKQIPTVTLEGAHD